MPALHQHISHARPRYFLYCWDKAKAIDLAQSLTRILDTPGVPS